MDWWKWGKRKWIVVSRVPRTLRDEARLSERGSSELFRRLPSVDELLRGEAMQTVATREGHAATVAAARSLLDELRTRIARGEMTTVTAAASARPCWVNGSQE